jgi:hypothetical protein
MFSSYIHIWVSWGGWEYVNQPTNKTETGIAYMWGTTNSKPPKPIIMINQLEILIFNQVQVIGFTHREDTTHICRIWTWG